MPRKTGGSYVGVELDDVDAENVATRAGSYSRLSDIDSLKGPGRERAVQAVSGFSARMRRFLSRAFWLDTTSHSKRFFGEAWVDLKADKTLRHNAWRIYTCVCPLLFIAGVVAILPIVTSRKLYQVSDACQPDSGFYVGYGEYNIWVLSGFFQITLGFGDFSFSMAKTIDVGWDIIVGRGGQALLAAVSFIVYSKALVRCMESSPVSYGTFEAITLQHGSLTASLKLARDLLKNKTAQARAAVVWMIISAAFVLGFQTFLSAMTGYSVNIASYVEVNNGNMILYKNFTLVRYIVHDAHRIDTALGLDYQVTTEGNAMGNPEITQLRETGYTDNCAEAAYPTSAANGTYDWSPTAKYPICDFYWHVSEYAYRYGFLGLNQTNSTFNHSGKLVRLNEPSLNITAIFWDEAWLDGTSNGTDWWYYPYGYYWKAANGSQPFHNISSPLFTNGQYTYDLEQLNDRGRCQQTGESYKWGFSFFALFIFVIAFLVWCVGMYALWLDAFLHSRFDRVGRTLGLQRAILDLAYCMHRDVDEDGRDMLSNADLQSKIRRDLKGGRITYEMLDPKFLPVSRATEWGQKWRETSKKDWLVKKKDLALRNNWWMLSFFVLSLGFLAASLAGTHAPLITPILLVFGSGNFLLTDERHKSRWLIFLAFVVLAGAFGGIGPYVYLDKSHYSLIWARQDAYVELDWWMNE